MALVCTWLELIFGCGLFDVKVLIDDFRLGSQSMDIVFLEDMQWRTIMFQWRFMW